MALLAVALPTTAGAQPDLNGPVAVAPTCLPSGVNARVVILGADWADGPVALFRDGASLGTAAARTRSTSQLASFTFTTTLTATSKFTVRATQGTRAHDTTVFVESDCPLRVSVEPDCVSDSGQVKLSGVGFQEDEGLKTHVVVDPFGDAETQPQDVAPNKGTFLTSVPITFTGAAIPIVVFHGSSLTVAFVDPCRPGPTNTATTARPPTPAPATTATTTATTTTTTVTGGPPGTPPAKLQSRGATADVSISPYTVRPGRCTVLVVSNAPPGLAVIARYADAAPVTSQTGPQGGAVLSLCHPHDSGIRLGPVSVLVGVGPLAPAPLFTVLRVPARPQPPLLTADADSRRSGPVPPTGTPPTTATP